MKFWRLWILWSGVRRCLWERHGRRQEHRGCWRWCCAPHKTLMVPQCPQICHKVSQFFVSALHLSFVSSLINLLELGINPIWPSLIENIYAILVFLMSFIFFRQNEITSWGTKRTALFQTWGNPPGNTPTVWASWGWLCKTVMSLLAVLPVQLFLFPYFHLRNSEIYSLGGILS